MKDPIRLYWFTIIVSLLSIAGLCISLYIDAPLQFFTLLYLLPILAVYIEIYYTQHMIFKLNKKISMYLHAGGKVNDRKKIK